MNIIILGPQGSGKGTQARLLSEKLGLFYFESGSFLREIAKTNKSVDETINKKGELVPDEEIFAFVKKYLDQNVPKGDNLLLDGYPRSLKQYTLLRDWLGEKGSKIDHAIFLEISDEESIRRLSARRICDKCGEVYNLITNPPPKGGCPCGGNLIQREDDKPEIIKKRLEEYKSVTQPLIEILEQEGVLRRVNGERPISAISADLLKIVGEKNG